MPRAIEDIEGYRFSFWSNEGREPIHVHVEKGGAEAKVWLEPELQFAWNAGFKQGQVRRIVDLLKENQHAVQEAWKRYLGS